GFAAADFNVETPTILGFGATASLNPSGTPNGFTVTSLQFVEQACSGICTDIFDTNTTFPPARSIAGFEFELPDPVNAIGSYNILIGRWISFGSQISVSSSNFVAGTLDITVPEVPEPASFLLLAGGLTALGAARRRSRK